MLFGSRACVVLIPVGLQFEIYLQRKIQLKNGKQNFTTFSVQTDIHMQIRVDGKVDWLLVTWGAVAGGRFMLH